MTEWNTVICGVQCSTMFVKMIQVLYGDIESVLKINGGLSAPFKINRGIRQGCSLSGMLYSIAIEPLLSRVREKLMGFKVADGFAPVCVSAYADNVVILVTL